MISTCDIAVKVMNSGPMDKELLNVRLDDDSRPVRIPNRQDIVDADEPEFIDSDDDEPVGVDI